MWGQVGFDVLLVAGGVIGLWLGALWFVNGATRVARRLGISGLVIGLTVVAFGTSAPEFAVAIDAALTGKSDISVGNVIGSNVVNLGFILGGTALVRALPVSDALVRRDGTVMIGTVLLVLVFLRDLTVSRVEGAVLFALLFVYLGVLVRTGADRVRGQGGDAEFRWPDAVRIGVGLVAVVGGAHLLVTGAADLAREAGVSEWVVGVTVVAAGTSAPEFATAAAAVYQGRVGVSAGNVVGSCIFNVLGVLGVASLIRPLPVVVTAQETTLWLLGISVVATALFWSRNVLSRAEGAVLVVLNAINWVVDLVG
jgi:cation:H+ antiporter